MIPALKSPRTFSPVQVAVATALGAPLAGAILLAVNEKRLGSTRRALIAACSGVLGTAGLVSLGATLPAPVARGFAVASIIAMHRVALQIRSTRPDADAEARASWWATAAIGLASLALIVGVAVLLAVGLGLLPRD